MYHLYCFFLLKKICINIRTFLVFIRTMFYLTNQNWEAKLRASGAVNLGTSTEKQQQQQQIFMQQQQQRALLLQQQLQQQQQSNTINSTQSSSNPSSSIYQNSLNGNNNPSTPAAASQQRQRSTSNGNPNIPQLDGQDDGHDCYITESNAQHHHNFNDVDQSTAVEQNYSSNSILHSDSNTAQTHTHLTDLSHNQVLTTREIDELLLAAISSSSTTSSSSLSHRNAMKKQFPQIDGGGDHEEDDDEEENNVSLPFSLFYFYMRSIYIYTSKSAIAL